MTGGGTAGDVAALRAAFEAVADPGYRKGSLRVAPTRLEVLGVRTPDFRRSARWVSRRRACLYLRDRDDALPALVRREFGNVIRTGRKSGRGN